MNHISTTITFTSWELMNHISTTIISLLLGTDEPHLNHNNAPLLGTDELHLKYSNIPLLGTD